MKAIGGVFAFVLFLALSAPAAAADFEAGWEAYEHGDYATALKEWLPLAERGHVTAQSNLGIMYSQGQGVPQNDAEAVKWLRLAAQQGDDTAQYNLGVRYFEGRGVPQDYTEAVKLYRLAAEHGLDSAQTNLGNMYRYGRGVPQDYTEAVR